MVKFKLFIDIKQTMYTAEKTRSAANLKRKYDDGISGMKLFPPNPPSDGLNAFLVSLYTRLLVNDFSDAGIAFKVRNLLWLLLSYMAEVCHKTHSNR